MSIEQGQDVDGLLAAATQTITNLRLRLKRLEGENARLRRHLTERKLEADEAAASALQGSPGG